MAEGQRVLINDGLVELRIIGREGRALLAKVEEGGLLTSRKGVNLPDSDLHSGCLTPKDLEDLAFGIEERVDAFALSYVAGAADILGMKKRLSQAGYNVPVIAKIERPRGVENIEEILDVTDGIMVARGDLGVEMSPSSVPILQKDLIQRANRKGRLTITATQMLESMTEKPVPTRAESADVANAILDGTDAVMLSAETSVGRFPVKAVRTMENIILETEDKGRPFRADLPAPQPGIRKDLDLSSLAVAEAAVRAAHTVGARCIAAVTRSGYTAGLLAKFRPEVPIIAFTPRPETVNLLKLHWGVVPYPMEHLESTDVMVEEVERTLVENRQASNGEDVVITASLPMADTGKTNFLKIHRIGG
jgi:pyruvate kinase